MMGKQRKRCLLTVCFGLSAFLTPAIAAPDPDAGDEAAASRLSGKGGVSSAADCDTIGLYDNLFSGANRYRGNVYHFDFRATLKEIKMELAFSGTTDLHVAIHRKAADGNYNRYPEHSSDIVIGGAVGLGAGIPGVYTTDTLDPPVDIEAGFDYAIAFAWGSKTITYGRDEQGYPVPFRAGEVLGLVAAGLVPPPPNPLVPETFPEFQIFDSGAYSMQLCFEPEKGACCSTVSGGCQEVLETACVGAGSFFHGEHTRCDETPCIFGACCDPCDGCHDPSTPEACVSDRPDRHWTAFDCPAADPELLCPIVTGACCRGTTCTQECRHNCEHPPLPAVPGTYRGDGTDCTPNFCPGAVGACCVTGGCLNRTQASCTSSGGTYKGPGTTCLTLPPEQECGGACCRGFENNDLQFCQHVASRAECTLDPKGGGFPYSAYRGDGTLCPALTPDPNDNCNDRAEVACCLPDGTCINTTSGFCQASWVKGESHQNVVCEDQLALCPSTLRRCCFPNGSCDLLTPTGCVAFGGVSSADTNCPINACSSSTPTGACCGNTAGQCIVKTEAQCNAQGGLYQGDVTNCNTPTTTCPGFGACCQEDGDCFDDVTSGQCGDLGGVYQNAGTVCATIECDQSGACCAITGTCLFITESQCGEIGGAVFQRVGVDCAADTCAGACCLSTGCEVRTVPDCASSAGVFQGVNVACEANLCKFGACCNGNTCSRQTQFTCGLDGGTYLGDGVACGVDVCGLGACCAGIVCSRTIRFGCEGGGHVFKGLGTSCDSPNICPCTDNVQCDDGNECTTIDRCDNGSCVNGRHKGSTEFALLAHCLDGPAQPIQSGCVCFDLNADDHVDLRDVAQFFLAFESP